jgi:hypothetical protein
MEKKGDNKPYIIATGFTTAFLGDERTLREFISGDLVKNRLEEKGANAVLYLINDSYDPLSYRQLRIAVNKDETFLDKFKGFCGRPISEVPDPFECHEHYAQHFERALLDRLRSLDIHPVVLDSYRAYRSGYYNEMIAVTLENYCSIQQLLAENFGLRTTNELFHIKCPKCLCMDATRLNGVKGTAVFFICERCNAEMSQERTEIQGKLSWKLDCAARWNIYGIDFEAFSKAHLAESGSFTVARFMSQKFYGGKLPDPVGYGEVKISQDLSGRLLRILPPNVLKALFTKDLTRDLILSRDVIENFCRGCSVRPGLSYLDYIRKELPIEALSLRNQVSDQTEPYKKNGARMLVAYGNQFSKFYYGKDYEIRLPTAVDLGSADYATAQTAREVIAYSLEARKEVGADRRKIIAQIRSFLFNQKATPELYHYLRKVFGQTDGPNITTLLSMLPEDYLRLIELVLSFHPGGNSNGIKNGSDSSCLDEIKPHDPAEAGRTAAGSSLMEQQFKNKKIGGR